MINAISFFSNNFLKISCWKEKCRIIERSATSFPNLLVAKSVPVSSSLNATKVISCEKKFRNLYTCFDRLQKWGKGRMGGVCSLLNNKVKLCS